ncbi:MAG: hypothetical protein LBN32_03425 [Helicobacteraceae bacterium]|jgi:hypothetical protein|nr:hypothetical protein [Helicobacteraceae bacterium]
MRVVEILAIAVIAVLLSSCGDDNVGEIDSGGSVNRGLTIAPFDLQTGFAGLAGITATPATVSGTKIIDKITEAEKNNKDKWLLDANYTKQGEIYTSADKSKSVTFAQEGTLFQTTLQIKSTNVAATTNDAFKSAFGAINGRVEQVVLAKQYGSDMNATFLSYANELNNSTNNFTCVNGDPIACNKQETNGSKQWQGWKTDKKAQWSMTVSGN